MTLETLVPINKISYNIRFWNMLVFVFHLSPSLMFESKGSKMDMRKGV